MPCRNLIVILGDQLSETVSSLTDIDPKQDRVLMMEVLEEATYVKHHKQKLVFIFSAMRHFAKQLRENGYTVDYIELTSPQSKSCFCETLRHYFAKQTVKKIIVTEASEYRVLEDMRTKWHFDIELDIRADNRFYCSKNAFQDIAAKHPTLRMEYFYRYMRKTTNILMQGDKPEGGKWNYDQQNRDKYDAKTPIPDPIQFPIDDISKNVIAMVEKKFNDHLGRLDTFNWAVTRHDALNQLDFFIENCLVSFGRFQDAMVNGEYTLFHSILSPYINIGLLTAKEVIDKVVDAYHKRDDLPINAVEGFVRQILGWREYVRGIYWLKMPEYANKNHLNANQPLPDFYWTANTKMACMNHVLAQTFDIAYSHHIQRLMITGNFALLAGISVEAICNWYLAVYLDAYEWVELPNTLGMVCYADEGLMASKPYAASGNYINKMSDFCKNCHYKVAQKLGEGACPFNILYWYFLIRNEDKLSNNRRLVYPYATLKRMDTEKKSKIIKQANHFLKQIRT